MAIRICQMITELAPAGAEACVWELATRLPPDRFHVEVAALRGGAVADRLRQAGVAVHTLGVTGRLDVTKWPRLVRILRRRGFDILHTHLFHADLAGRPAGIAAGVRHIVHTVHVAERRFRPWQFAWARWMAASADRIVCVSTGVRDFHARRAGLPLGRYTVIHNGIDAARYARDTRRRAELRRRWGLGDDDVLCAFVGRLDRQKGVDVLLEAFAASAAACGRLHLLLAGDGPLAGLVTRWMARSPSAPRVRAIGFTDDVPAVLAAADVFVQPSRWEGFCLAAAEAMAAALPVVACDVPGLNEVVADGQTGILCRPDSPACLTDALTRLAEDADLRAALGAAGLRRVKQRFDVATFIDRHAALYQSLLAGRPNEAPVGPRSI